VRSNKLHAASMTVSLHAFATSVTPWVALIAGGQFFMAGCLHVFWHDGGKYRAAGFDVTRFDTYTHSVLMFMSCVEGSPQVVRGALLVLSGFLFPEYAGALVAYDALDGIALFFLGGYFFGGVKPVPSPPRGSDGTLPGSKLHAAKTVLMGAIGLVWILAGRPVVEPLPPWAMLVPLVQIPAMFHMFSKTFVLPEEARAMVADYMVSKNKGAAYHPWRDSGGKTH